MVKVSLTKSVPAPLERSQTDRGQQVAKLHRLVGKREMPLAVHIPAANEQAGDLIMTTHIKPRRRPRENPTPFSPFSSLHPSKLPRYRT